MGRHAKELPTEQADTCIVEFAAALRSLREQAGNPTLAEMASRAGISTASLSKAAGGHEIPSWRVTEAYVEACGHDPKSWRKRWENVRRATRPREFVSDEFVESLNLDPEQRRRASWPRIWERWDRTGMILPTHRAETALDLRIALQSLRAYRSLSLRQLAILMPYSHSTVAAVLSGARPVSAFFLRNYLQACGVTTYGEVLQWMDLLRAADPTEKSAAGAVLNSTLRDNGGNSISYAWRPRLPISSEIDRLKKVSLRERSDHLRTWLLGKLDPKARNAIYRRLEKLYGINAVDLRLFERQEWSLSLDQLNKIVREVKRHGFKDIDPVVDS
ncbi:helix-turn-helix domain-containing protein [Streptomyces avermitilis]|uniref:helix-turn-helix domain-containing protein n=1 Tax=Streptomyces avermitilis TaxID=33903 RepID=UPI0033D7FB25